MTIENKGPGGSSSFGGNINKRLDEVRQQAAARQAAQLEAFEKKAHAEAQAKLEPAGDKAAVTGDAANPETSTITGPKGDQAITPAPSDVPFVLDNNHAALAGQPEDVRNAVATLTALSDRLAGSPAERTAAIAEALTSDPPLQQQLAALQKLPPEFKQLADEELAALNQAATPQALASMLKSQVDFKDLDGDTVGTLAKLAGTTQDPALRGELGSLATEAMNAGAITADKLQARPELGQFLLITKDAPDPAVRGQVQDTLRSVVNQVMDRQIGAGEKFNFDSIGKLQDAAKDLDAIAGAAGLKDAIGPAAKEVGQARFPHDDGGFSVGDFASDIGGAVGDVSGTALQVAASGVDGAGQLAGGAVEGATNVAADGLEVVHLDGEADALREKGKDAAASITDATDKASEVLDVAGTFAKDGLSGGAERLADDLIGPQIPAFKDQVDGFTGMLTNRLDRGDSVFINATVSAEVSEGAEIGFEVNGKGAKAEAGEKATASLTGGATLGRNPDGTISLTLELGGKAGVEETAGVKADLGAAKASVEAEAGISAEGKGKVTFKFDPTKPEDVARLKQFTEPQNVLAGSNPVGAVLITGPAVQDAMKNNLESTEFGGQVGANVGVKAQVDVGSITAKAGIEANAALGEKVKNNRDGSQEVTVFVRGGVSASASVGEKHTGLEAGATVGANGALGLTVKTDPNGQIVGISGEADGDVGAGVGSHDTTTVTHTLTPAGLAEANKRIAAGASPLTAFLDLQNQPGMSSASKRSTHTDDASLDFSAGADLFVGVDVGIDITVGHSKSKVEQLDPAASSLTQDVVQSGQGARIGVS
ncbi:MAG: hypothetical protein JWM80_6532 [Cyanobacteria bacterium RYN_339]|nr:hypothetical protein [Cyanobacteria bacterium RYN_339]